MRGYDLPDKIPEPEKTPPCEHIFMVKDGKIITEYSPALCLKVIQHGQAGFFIESFSGKHNVCVDKMCEWLSDPVTYKDFNSAVKISTSACIQFWNCELIHAVDSKDWQGVTVIRSFLSEIMKVTPKALRENLFSSLHQKTAEELNKEKELENQAAFFDAVKGTNE